jgi:hypothetical protein
MAKKPYIIALEEHYLDPEVKQLGGGPGAGRDIVERLDDLGALRIREMDEAGIDLQVRPWAVSPCPARARPVSSMACGSKNRKPWAAARVLTV